MPKNPHADSKLPVVAQKWTLDDLTDDQQVLFFDLYSNFHALVADGLNPFRILASFPEG